MKQYLAGKISLSEAKDLTVCTLVNLLSDGLGSEHILKLNGLCGRSDLLDQVWQRVQQFVITNL